MHHFGIQKKRGQQTKSPQNDYLVWKNKRKYFAMPLTKNKVNSRATCNFIQIISKIQFNAESWLLTLDFFPILIMNFSTEFSWMFLQYDLTFFFYHHFAFSTRIEIFFSLSARADMICPFWGHLILSSCFVCIPTSYSKFCFEKKSFQKKTIIILR